MANNWQALARSYAQKHNIDPGVFVRQMGQEAHGQDLTSPAGAEGPAQFMPGTARSLGVRNPHDINQAYDGAARLMASYVHKYGNYKDALVAYNAGPGRVGGSLPAETQNYVRTILGGSNPTSGGSGAATTTTTRSFVPGVNRSQQRGQILLNYELGQASHDTTGTGLLGAIQQIAGLKDTPGHFATSTSPPSGGSTTGTGDIVARANQIAGAHLPYQWGGGHGGKVDLNHLTPLDCSGAVSAVLGIDPRVSGQFESWGKPGAGGKVTIYANSTHVLMSINGHLFGTSQSNPGGGAGWIPAGAVPPGYLKRFVARHM